MAWGGRADLIEGPSRSQKGRHPGYGMAARLGSYGRWGQGEPGLTLLLFFSRRGADRLQLSLNRFLATVSFKGPSKDIRQSQAGSNPRA